MRTALAGRRNLLVLLADLEVGGGQLSTIRLLNNLTRLGNVYLYNVRPAREEREVTARIDPAVRRLRSLGEPREVADYISELAIEVANTHIWWADVFYHRVLQLLPHETRSPRWVLSMHGCYELLQTDLSVDPQFVTHGEQVLRTADAIVYGADKNIASLPGQLSISAKATKIRYGYQPPDLRPVSRATLGIAETDFVFCLVSRATPEKGWECAIQALELVRGAGHAEAHLILVGGGAYQEEMGAKCRGMDHVHFTGTVPDPQNYVAICDVGLLPSWFPGESQPNCIIEFLAQWKPVIATELGEIREMMSCKDGVAGIIIPAEANQPLPPERRAQAMLQLRPNPGRLPQLAVRAARAARKFQMDDWVDRNWRVFFPEAPA